MVGASRGLRIAASVTFAVLTAACAQPGRHGASETTTLPMIATAPGAPGVTEIAAPATVRPGVSLAQLTSLKDRSDRELIGRLGQPYFVRHEAEAEIWQYRSPTCVLDIFLYPAPGGGLKAAHVATRSRTELQAPEDQCVPFTETAIAG